MGVGVILEGSKVVLFSGGRSRTACPRAANDNGPAEPKQTVTVRRKLEKSGVPIKIKVPVEEFIGVAVSSTITPEGLLSSAIELVHGDPELNYRVFEETGNSSVVAEWQNWGRKLRLPLYIRAGDGNLLPYSQHVDGVVLGPKVQRRAPQTQRRTRFLNGKPGGEVRDR